ncbi:reductive dehalogenase [Alkalibacter rhizosphaerae]|uniref:Reductive dehalogenase n=1 Tax=Alkalibacter rhizosphaerae TaxID=2815577 RepID=A0A974XDB2_9FIRM|nr:reductive dehalogenase [Alkalibacter rhizosphaerae]QSX07551.1 reductive dehalogenase [Alkalibacter rhizosphaerae]
MIPRNEMKEAEKAYVLDESLYQRYPVTRQAFVTVSTKDKGEISYLHFLEKMKENMVRRMMEGEKGHQQQDNALDLGANAFNLIIGQYGFPNFQLLQWKPMFTPELMQKTPLALPSSQLTTLVKDGAQLYGADLVGITDLDPKWIYSQDLFKPFVLSEGSAPEETEEAFLIPRKINKSIVMAFAMNDDMINESPEVPASTATSIGYSRMGIAVVALAEYIRALGYQAIPSMNDTALNIPLAVEAGLGQLGRLGLLITPEFGPNVRLAKVLTDMPLDVDSPVDFGITEFCKNCYLCADHCPSGSIGYGEPTLEGVCDNNNSGVEKWYIYPEKCLRYWQKNGSSCANCIAVCPFTRGFESMQCFECDRCETKIGCALQVNTHLRIKYGYLESNVWGNQPKVLKPRRKGF